MIENRQINSNFTNIKTVNQVLFGDSAELLPNVDEIFELELANMEMHSLSKQELIKRSAFFKKIDNNLTEHYLLYKGKNSNANVGRSSMVKSYFEEGQFSTGYATHGLFPYRGKFHPQLVKSLLNIVNVKNGEVVLDPMAGSGTTNIEAAMLGLNSIACDISPFCNYMIKVKYESLLINKQLLDEIDFKSTPLFNYFKKGDVINRIQKIACPEKQKIYNLAFLAWLDALGYSKRVVRSNHEQLFEKVLFRYIETVKTLINNSYFKQTELGKIDLISSSALDLNIANESVDCVITSPPYSFAIDYVKNDELQLEFLGYDTSDLKKKLIGLRGRNKNERLDNYFIDMELVCAEISRVLKNNKFFIMIVGSNTNQTGGVRLEQTIINSAAKFHLNLVKTILKPIRGLRSTMKDEYILIFKKETI